MATFFTIHAVYIIIIAMHAAAELHHRSQQINTRVGGRFIVAASPPIASTATVAMIIQQNYIMRIQQTYIMRIQQHD